MEENLLGKQIVVATTFAETLSLPKQTWQWMNHFWKNSLRLEQKTGNAGKTKGKEALSGKGEVMSSLLPENTSLVPGVTPAKATSASVKRWACD